MNTNKWKKIQNKGRLFYTVVNGLLIKGITFAILFSATAPLFLGETATFTEMFPGAIVFFPIAGLITNLLVWPVNEWAYSKLAPAMENPETDNVARRIIPPKVNTIHSLYRRRSAA